MVSNSKILTVSYGTFSCTLEGFDDSFDTMKAIAEYFRDLASEDRYFGAEPPVPDAEMLARIAEREIARRVEAREERGNIVLRAAPYGAMAAPLAPFTAPQSATAAMPSTSGAPAQAPVQAAPAQPTPAPQPVSAPSAKAASPEQEWEDVAEAPAPPMAPAPAPAPAMATPPLRPTPVPHPDPDSVAAKLQRIRDVVTKSAAITEAQSFSEDEHAENFLSDTVETMETALELDEQSHDDTAGDDDEIASLLSRLAQDSPAAEADTAQPFADDWDDESVAANGIATDPVDFGDSVDSAGTNAANRDSTDDAAALSAVAVDEDGFYDEPLSETETEIQTAAARDAMSPFHEDLDENELDENDLDEDDLDTFELDTFELNEEEAIAAELDEDDSDIARSRAVAEAARVFTVKRAAFDAAIARGELVAAADDAADEAGMDHADTAAQARSEIRRDMPKLKPHHDLSAEDEEALRRELEAVEAELLETDRDADGHILTSLDDEDFEEGYEDEGDLQSLFEDEDDEAGEARTDAATPDAPLVLRDPRERLVQSGTEDDVSRLMAKAESALTEPENESKRNAIAHLRKAVAATKAEQSAGTLPDRTPATSAFREDLADVVRPRRPVADVGAARPRPAETRPAPLKLVAEQRVDLPEGHFTADRPTAPVRPRRVSLAALPEDGEEGAVPVSAPVAEGGFADFAKKMGATALPDLLEAAAAYLVHVEGNDEFSRPQLMTKARQAADGLSREDGLRALGQLLRQGKLQKMRGGLFTASDDIGFKPNARRVG